MEKLISLSRYHKKGQIVIYIVLFCLLPSITLAQDYRIIPYNSKQGLHNNLTKAITEDKFGFIWIATDNGLERFDGLNFKLFSTGLPSNYVKSFHTSSNGDLFAITDMGIIKIISKPDTAYFQTIALGGVNYSDTSLFYAKLVFEDLNNNLWITDNNSVWHYKEGKLKKYTFNKKDYTINFQRSFSIAESKKGKLFVFSETGYSFFYNKMEDRFEEQTNIPKFNSVDDACFIDDSRILIASYTGVSILDLSGKKPEINTILNTDACKIEKVKDSVFFVANWTNGVYKLTFNKGKYTSESLQNIQSSKINNLFLDKKQNLWVSTDYGVILCQKMIFNTMPQFLNKYFVQSIDVSNDGKVYCIAGGAYAISSTNNQIKLDLIYTLNKEGNLCQVAVSKVDSSVVYLSTTNAHLIVLKNKKLINNIDLSSYGRVLFFITCDKDGYVWACLDGCNGILKISPDYKVKLYDYNKGLTSRGIVVRQNKFGEVYCGGVGDSTYLFRYDYLKDSFTNLSQKLPFEHSKNIVVNDITFDRNKIWLASSEGVVLYDNNNFELLINGEFSRKNTSCITSSKNGYLWFSNDNGLFKYKDGKLYQFDENDGLNSNVGSYRCLAVDKNEMVWFGTQTGLNYSVQNILSNTTDKPLITDILLNDKEISIDTSNLELLKYSYISFKYISLNMPGNEIIYQTRLTGYSNEWSQPTNQNEIIFPNLPIGNYIFEVRAKQHGSYDWSETSSISFSVQPNWYQTWWVFILYIILFLLFVIVFIILYNKRLIQQKIKLEKLLKKHTTEILMKNEQLQYLNATKDKFFSIIAHDLKSPFSGIIGILEYIVTSFDQLKEEEKLELINSVFSTSKNTFSLLENLLVWARSQTNSIQFNPEPTSLEHLIKNAIDMSEAVWQSKEIKINYSVNNDRDVKVDKNMITTVLRNLIVNAIKYSHKDSTISINGFTNNSIAYISVTDNGVGIESKRLKDLFEINVKSSTNGTENEKGTGLGLILCKEFIEKHNGTIGVKSKFGFGSTFWFEIPIKE